MGQFSWLDENAKQILDDVYEDSFLLVPREFRKEYDVRILERCYDGYGHFGGYDVFDLVAIWNRKFISNNPEFMTHEGKVSDYSWYPFFADLSLTIDEALQKWADSGHRAIFGNELRNIGIDLACYDEDNASLMFPIKITHNSNAVYEWEPPSKSDPNQGWDIYADDEWY